MRRVTPEPPLPLHPAVFYDAFGQPSDGVVDRRREDVVIPTETCVFATFQGPMLLRKGIPQVVGDATLRNEMRTCGVIA
jgi:hypothetical protein